MTSICDVKLVTVVDIGVDSMPAIYVARSYLGLDDSHLKVVELGEDDFSGGPEEWLVEVTVEQPSWFTQRILSPGINHWDF